LAEGFADPHGRQIMRQLAVCWLRLSEQSNKSLQRERQPEASQDRSAV
jgi:hypothetical protein